MKNIIAGLLLTGLVLASTALGLPLSMNMANSILPNGTKITLSTDVTINHTFPEFFVQSGKVFASEYGTQPGKPICKSNFTIHHQDGECKMSSNEVFKMGPTVIKSGTYAVSCGKSDPSLRNISFMVPLGSGKTLRLNCAKDSLLSSRAHITASDIKLTLKNEAIDFR